MNELSSGKGWMGRLFGGFVLVGVGMLLAGMWMVWGEYEVFSVAMGGGGSGGGGVVSPPISCPMVPALLLIILLLILAILLLILVVKFLIGRCCKC